MKTKYILSIIMIMFACSTIAAPIPTGEDDELLIEGVWTETLSTSGCDKAKNTVNAYFHTQYYQYFSDLPISVEGDTPHGIISSTYKASYITIEENNFRDPIERLIAKACMRVSYYTVLMPATLFVTQRTASINKTNGKVTIVAKGIFQYATTTGLRYSTFKYKGELKGTVSYPQ